MKIGKSTPWSYRKGFTVLHRLPGGFKLAFLLMLSLAVFIPGPLIQSLVILSGIALLIITLSFIAGTGPWGLLRGGFPLFVIILVVFVFQGIEFSPPRIKLNGLLEASIFCVRIGTAFAAGSLLFSVTTPGEIRKSISRLEALMHLQKLNIALSISLMLGFLPRFFAIWEEVTLAWKSRGGKSSLSRLVILIPLVIEKMMNHAAETAEAMESRGALL